MMTFLRSSSAVQAIVKLLALVVWQGIPPQLLGSSVPSDADAVGAHISSQALPAHVMLFCGSHCVHPANIVNLRGSKPSVDRGSRVVGSTVGVREYLDCLVLFDPKQRGNAFQESHARINGANPNSAYNCRLERVASGLEIVVNIRCDPFGSKELPYREQDGVVILRLINHDDGPLAIQIDRSFSIQETGDILPTHWRLHA